MLSGRPLSRSRAQRPVRQTPVAPATICTEANVTDIRILVGKGRHALQRVESRGITHQGQWPCWPFVSSQILKQLRS